MPRNERGWDSKFVEYQNMEVNHPNYKGLPITRRKDGSLVWLAPKKGDVGKARLQWALDKSKELGLPPSAAPLADVMREIHPTKIHICQPCGSEMSIFYLYPNANFVKSINKKFNSQISTNDHIGDVWDSLVGKGVKHETLVEFFQSKFKIDKDVSDKDEIIRISELACRKGGRSLLGPGAMSNFPDRFDGFHSYNRCCRGSQDTGRSKENLSSYNKDRRAFELWSDGNLHAANKFMRTPFFNDSADHIGPISLGFIHDPRYLRPMASGDNSSKRDKLLIEDVEEILKVEERTKVYPMSWYSREIWEFIKQNYKANTGKVGGAYRKALKQNFTNFMFALKCIIDHGGGDFLVAKLLKPNHEDFMFDYEFNALGEITSRTDRRTNDSNRKEFGRYVRIAMDSVEDYSKKKNRKSKPNLIRGEVDLIDKINALISSKEFDEAFSMFQHLMTIIQHRLIAEL